MIIGGYMYQISDNVRRLTNKEKQQTKQIHNTTKTTNKGHFGKPFWLKPSLLKPYWHNLFCSSAPPIRLT